jgi:hypothetical protein
VSCSDSLKLVVVKGVAIIIVVASLIVVILGVFSTNFPSPPPFCHHIQYHMIKKCIIKVVMFIVVVVASF